MSSSRTSADNVPAGDEADVALRLTDVTVAFDGAPVLASVAGMLRAGESLALVGPNGAGKTTLIRALVGLVPLVKGDIEVLGTTPQRARHRVAYVPQAEAFDGGFPVSVLDVVLMGRYRKIGWFHRPKQLDRELAMGALEEVDLADRHDERFGRLSGGQRQRVLLARAVAQQADILLLDEPFNGVDVTTTDVVLSVLHRLRAEGAAVVMSTHDLSVAHLACTDACLLNHHQFAFGPIDTTLTPELLRQTYGGRAVLLAGESTVIATG